MNAKKIPMDGRVNEKLTQSKVWFSTARLRADNGKQLWVTVSELVNNLLNLNSYVVVNKNIKNKNLNLFDSGS